MTLAVAIPYDTQYQPEPRWPATTTSDYPLPDPRKMQRIVWGEDLLVIPEPPLAHSEGTQTSPVSDATGAIRVPHPEVVLQLPRLPATREFFRALQRWEGYVLAVTEDSFLARLVPIVGEGPSQEAEISLEELEQEDRRLVEPGAVFYWSIGYLDRPSGRLRISLIRFRRLPAWSSHEIERARADARELGVLLGTEESRERTGTGRD